MKTLTFVYAKFFDKEITFVTLSPESLNLNHAIVPLEVTSTLEYKIKKNNPLYLTSEKLFSTANYLVYEGHLPFEAHINSPSFSTELLLENNLYQPQTRLEQFLSGKGLLKAYYQKALEFTIKVIREEYSKEFGEKKFEHQYQTQRLEEDFFVPRVHSTYLYSSQAVQEIVGIHKNGKPVPIVGQLYE